MRLMPCPLRVQVLAALGGRHDCTLSVDGPDRGGAAFSGVQGLVALEGNWPTADLMDS